MKRFKSRDYMQKGAQHTNAIITMSHHYKYNRFREGGWGHRYQDLPQISKLMNATARHTQSFQ